MKKFAFILAPLMAISFLTNCGGQSGPKLYTVTFDLNGGTSEAIPAQTIKEGERATEPKDPTRNEDEIGIYTFNEWQLDGNKFDFSTPINKNLTLKADWSIAHKYSVTVGTCEHLSFTTTDDKELSTIKAIEGREFKFKMKVTNTSNEIEYLVPTSLDIKINDGPSLASGYTITPNADENEAEVSINADKVVGNIIISGKAAEAENYFYKVSAYDGLYLNIPEEGKQNKNQNLVIAFTTKDKESSNDKYTLPKKENIFIEFDNVNDKKEWISPAMSEPIIQQEYCEYDEQNGVLTIKTNHIKNSIDIKTRANDYPLLEKLSWEQINGYSLAGWAPYIFYIGEEKTIRANDIDQKVRIIDLNHDDLVDVVGKAGITFEFVNLLSDSNGYSLATFWNANKGKDSKNYNYLEGNLRKALDGQGTGTLRWYQKDLGTKSTTYTKPVIDMLPSELRNNIKTVKKYVAKDTSFQVKDYAAKVFVLTHDEITTTSDHGARAEGTTYKYYINHFDDSSRIKHQIKWHDKAASKYTKIIDADINWNAHSFAGYNNPTDSYGANYWLASPYIVGAYWNACGAKADGSLGNSTYSVFVYAYPIAPAFCI